MQLLSGPRAQCGEWGRGGDGRREKKMSLLLLRGTFSHGDWWHTNEYLWPTSGSAHAKPSKPAGPQAASDTRSPVTRSISAQTVFRVKVAQTGVFVSRFPHHHHPTSCGCVSMVLHWCKQGLGTGNSCVWIWRPPNDTFFHLPDRSTSQNGCVTVGYTPSVCRFGWHSLESSVVGWGWVKVKTHRGPVTELSRNCSEYKLMDTWADTENCLLMFPVGRQVKEEPA